MRHRPALPGIVMVLALLVARPALAVSEFRGHGGPVKGVAAAPDNQHLASASFDYSIILWQRHDPEPLAIMHGHDAAVNAVRFLDDGEALISASDDGTLALWRDRALVQRWPAHDARVAALAVSPDGSVAASGGFDGNARLWSLPEGKAIGDAIGQGAPVSALSFSPDGRWLAVGGAEGGIDVVRTEDQTRVFRLAGHGFPINALQFSANGRELLSASADETIEIWSMADGQPIGTLYGHDGPVLTLSLSPDGKNLLSGGMDGFARLWRLADERRLIAQKAHAGPVWSVVFTADGESFVSSGGDTVVRLWHLNEMGVVDPDALAITNSGRSSPRNRGEELFAKCAACHTLTPDGGNRAGPTLYNVFGRVAGSLPGYPYSQALLDSDVIWTRETIDQLFAIGPHEMTPGSKMPLQRMANTEDRAALIDYLAEVTQPDGNGTKTGTEER